MKHFVMGNREAFRNTVHRLTIEIVKQAFPGQQLSINHGARVRTFIRQQFSKLKYDDLEAAVPTIVEGAKQIG